MFLQPFADIVILVHDALTHLVMKMSNGEEKNQHITSSGIPYADTMVRDDVV